MKYGWKYLSASIGVAMLNESVEQWNEKYDVLFYGIFIWKFYFGFMRLSDRKF